VRAIEEVDAEFVGPFLAGMAALSPYRLITVSDPGSVHQRSMAEAHWPYAYQDPAKPAASGRRFTEADAKAMATAPRDATKFVVRLFAKGS
jgi:2,3-bisphosphoglycerate-independent phosphoglycerate mutase